MWSSSALSNHPRGRLRSPSVRPVSLRYTFACVLCPPLLARLQSCDPSNATLTACMIQLLLDSCSYLADRTAIALSKSPENIEEHCAAIKNFLFTGVTQVVGHVLKGCRKIWCTAESWNHRSMTGRNRSLYSPLRVMVVLRCSNSDTLQNPEKFNILCGVTKGKFILRWSGKQGRTQWLRSIYRTMEVLACPRKSFDGPVKE